MELFWRISGKGYAKHNESMSTSCDDERSKPLLVYDHRKIKNGFPWFASSGSSPAVVINSTEEESYESNESSINPQSRWWLSLFCWQKSKVQHASSKSLSLSSFPMVVGNKLSPTPMLTDLKEKHISFPTETRRGNLSPMSSEETSGQGHNLNESWSIPARLKLPQQTLFSTTISPRKLSSKSLPSKILTNQKALIPQSKRKSTLFQRQSQEHSFEKTYLNKNPTPEKSGDCLQDFPLKNNFEAIHSSTILDFSPIRITKSKEATSCQFQRVELKEASKLEMFPEFDESTFEDWFSDFECPYETNFSITSPPKSICDDLVKDIAKPNSLNSEVAPLFAPNSDFSTSYQAGINLANTAVIDCNSSLDIRAIGCLDKSELAMQEVEPVTHGDESSLVSFDSLVASYWDPEGAVSLATPLTSNCYHNHLDFLQTRLAEN